MKKINILILISAFCSMENSSGQIYSDSYNKMIGLADSFYQIHDYKNSGMIYEKAFKIDKRQILDNTGYNAACAWSMAGFYNNAFNLLYNIARKGVFTNYNWIVKDSDLFPLHSDKRWQPLLDIILANKRKPIISTLDSYETTINDFYIKEDSIGKLYGFDSEQRINFYKTRLSFDTIHLKYVCGILDQYGWPGPELIGYSCNRTMQSIMGEADLLTLEKYMPMIRNAVLNGKAEPGFYAFQQDRVFAHRQQKQIYGTYVFSGMKDGERRFHLYPLVDPDNVDKRRAEIGLSGLATYLLQYGIVWNIVLYKLENPEKADK